ncbi:MAG: SDR family NAD(P)-dependent oxidoreductase, partial [Beijerinckiaceae bacterium]
MFDLTGLNALVTGATGGLGGAMARALHAQGATVALSGTRAAALEALADQVVPEETTPWNSTLTPMVSAADVRAQLLAIAA